jgi:hypothetical protein
MSEVIEKKQKADDYSIRSAALDTGTFNVDDNSVSVVFATETPVLTRDWETGELFNEVLSMDPAHVRSQRLDAGLPVLDNHKKYGSVKKQLGSSRDGVIDKAKKVARATLFLSKRKSLKGFCGDVRDGLIKNISAGYKVYLYRDISKAGDKIRTLLAIDWEPTEISFTQVQADYKSSVRAFTMLELAEGVRADGSISEPAAVEGAGEKVIEPSGVEAPVSEGEQSEENLNHTRSINMVETEEQKQVRLAAEDKVRKDAVVADRQRSADIREAGRAAKWDDATIEGHISDDEMTADKVRALVVKELHKVQEGGPVTIPVSGVVTAGERNEREANIKAFEEAIMVRSFGVSSLGKQGPQTEYGKRAANGRRISLMDHAVRAIRATGENPDMWSEHEVFTRSMSTGDFPKALENVMNKTLRQRYESYSPVWQKFAKKISAKDFKAINSVQVDGDTKFGKLTEKGEYPYVKFTEAADNFSLDTYGLTTGVTRQMFINDDLGAFENFAPFFYDGMLDNQTTLVYAALIGDDGLGRTLKEDNVKLFNAAKHNNLDSVGAAMSIESFKVAVTNMRRQKTLAGRRMMQNRPRFLVIPPELEQLAYQLINATIVPNTTSEANPFKGQFEILIEDFFEDPEAWFLIADPARVESVKYATLDGQEGIFTEQWWDPKTDSWQIKARNDFSATVEEFRGVYKNVGA